MKEIHPKIKKFWTDAGYSVLCFKPKEINPFMAWNVCWAARNDTESYTVAVTDTIGYKGITEDSAEVHYYFNTRRYTEKEMLRIIKLKAFL